MWAPVALVGVVAVFAAAAWLWLSGSRKEAPQTALAEVPRTSLPGAEVSPSFSPDGNQVAFAWNGKTQSNFDIYVQTLGSGDALQRTTHPADDFSPAWSPDGRHLAFLRNLGSSRLAVILTPPISGAERLLTEVQSPAGNYPGQITLAWHPEGKHLAVKDGAALVLVAVETGDKQPLTTPPPTVFDFSPAFSLDGRRLAFARGNLQASVLYQLSLGEGITPRGEPTALATDMEYANHPAWTANDREIVFEAGLWAPSLWRLTVAGPGSPHLLPSADEMSTQPAISPDGRRLAYSRWVIDYSIYRFDLAGGGAAASRPARHIASSRQEYNPQFSPDGTRVAFESDRWGTPEIWVCDRDGSNWIRLTSVGGPLTGTPRWSPDGQQIVFDSRPAGQSDIFVVAANGGKPRRLTTNPASDECPSWSGDGQWIYFTSNRSGRAEVWRVPATATSVPEQATKVTQNGGGMPYESTDGKLVYYARGGSVWQIPVAGGGEIRLVESASPYFAVTDKGIYLFPRGETAVWFFDVTTKATHPVAVLDQLPFVGLTVSPDGRTMLFTLRDTFTADLMLVEPFR